MRRFFSATFWISIICIVLDILLFVVFKLVNFTGECAATIIGLLSFIGGILMIIGSIGLFFSGPLPSPKREERLTFLLPELIAVGVLFMFVGIIFIFGKALK